MKKNWKKNIWKIFEKIFAKFLKKYFWRLAGAKLDNLCREQEPSLISLFTEVRAGAELDIHSDYNVSSAPFSFWIWVSDLRHWLQRSFLSFDTDQTGKEREQEPSLTIITKHVTKRIKNALTSKTTNNVDNYCFKVIEYNLYQRFI